MINIIVTPLLLKCMQRVLVMVAAIVLSLSFSNYSNLVEAESSTEDCWVIVKENYEWVHDDEQMVASHSSESNLTYDSQCRLVEKTVQTIDSLHHYFTSYNEDDTISNTTTYWYGSQGDIIYLWQEEFTYDNGVMINSTWTEFEELDGNLSINQVQTAVYLYDNEGRIILTNTTQGNSYTAVSTNYDAAGNIIEVNTTYNDQLTTSIGYEYNSENKLISETINEFYGSSQFSKTINSTYDQSGKLIFKEQHDEPNNWTIFWNYTYDDNGNKVAENFNRVGNSPWATVTTYTWGYGFEQSVSETDTSDTEEDSPFDICLILVVIALIVGSVYFISNRIAAASAKTLAEMVGNKLVGDMFEEE